MNTIKFVNDELTATEQHIPQYEERRKVNIDGKEIVISNPVNLNILLTYTCNCKCDFCIVEQNDKKTIIQDDMYVKRLGYYFDMLKDLPLEITITGGEPTLCEKRLLDVLELIDRYGFRHRTFSTNGACLTKRIDGKPILQYMKEHRAIHNINLSRMHMDQNTNDFIFQGKTISLNEIKKIAMFCALNDMDLRLSCNLMKSGMSSVNDIFSYIKKAEDLGIYNVMFRELVGKAKESIDIRPIMKELNTVAETVNVIETELYQIKILRLKDIFQKNYIVKEYVQKPIKSTTINSLVYREGILTPGWD